TSWPAITNRPVVTARRCCRDGLNQALHRSDYQNIESARFPILHTSTLTISMAVRIRSIGIVVDIGQCIRPAGSSQMIAFLLRGTVGIVDGEEAGAAVRPLDTGRAKMVVL